MSITITLTFTSVDAAVRALRSLPESDLVVGPISEAAPGAEPKKRGRPPKATEPTPEPTPEPAPSSPAEPEPATPEPAKTVTIDDLRAAAVAAVGKVGRDAVIALARRYGAEKPTAVDQARWPELLADLKAAGGQ